MNATKRLLAWLVPLLFVGACGGSSEEPAVQLVVTSARVVGCDSVAVAGVLHCQEVAPPMCEAARAFADDHERRGQYAFASGARLTMHNFMGCP